MITTKICTHFRIYLFKIKVLICVKVLSTRNHNYIIRLLKLIRSYSFHLFPPWKGFYYYLLWQQMNWELQYKDNTFLFFAFCLLDCYLALAVVYAKPMLLTSHFPESFFLLICAPIISSMWLIRKIHQKHFY